MKQLLRGLAAVHERYLELRARFIAWELARVEADYERSRKYLAHYLAMYRRRYKLPT